MLNPNAKPFQYQNPSLLPYFNAPSPLLQPEQPLLLPPSPLCTYFPFFTSQNRPCLKDNLVYVYHAAPPPLLPPLPSLASNGNCTTAAFAATPTSTATRDVGSKLGVSDTPAELSEASKRGCSVGRRFVTGRVQELRKGNFMGCSRGKNYGLMWRPKVEYRPQEGFPSTFDIRGHESMTLRGQTTVMIKNIPNKFSREMLLDLLDNHCKEENEKLHTPQLSLDPCSEYDFVYLPMDFRNRCNLGYAFVNFTSDVAVLKLYRSLHNWRWNVFGTKKICEIRRAKIQGKEALLGHFRNSHFKCDTDDFLPVILAPPRNGSTSCTPPSIVGKRTAASCCD